MFSQQLVGKTVFVVDRIKNDRLLASLLINLEKHGAMVVFLQHTLQEPDDVPSVFEEIANHSLKPDALIIHHPDSANHADQDSQIATIALAKRLNKTLPVVVHDWHNDLLVTRRLENAGAKFVGFEGPGDKISFAVADAIAQHGKAGKEIR